MNSQAIARAQNSSNLDSDTSDFCHHDTDTLIAVGGQASRLASLLLRARNAGQDQWGREIVLLLAHRIKRHKLSRGIAERVAFAALMEWLQPHCRCCNGAREIQQDKLLVICHSCGGVGVHRYTDTERAGMCGVAFAGRIKLAHEEIGSEISTEVANALHRVRAVGG